MIPKILDTMHTLDKFESAMMLDLEQGFYAIPLDKESQKICMTVTLWGKYAHMRMLMRIACAPNMFQSIMTEILDDLDYVIIYIDDILCLKKEGKSVDNLLKKLVTILNCLEKTGF